MDATPSGLLTGDTSINGEAPVVVMTTEVLRNMLYAGSTTLDNLSHVVMDGVHYLADRFRGAVWEEIIIHLPSEVIVLRGGRGRCRMPRNSVRGCLPCGGYQKSSWKSTDLFRCGST